MSALTSLLVRDDAVAVRQIEEALARQVVDGGELDTALLELGALPENHLAAYRAASERAQPASREDVMSASPGTIALVPSELALAYQVTPLSHDGKTLLVASMRALHPGEIIEISERTGLRVEYRVTTELRVHAALARFYGRALPPRLATLLPRVEAQPSGELVAVAPLRPSARAAHKTEQLPAFDEAEDFQSVLAAAFDRASKPAVPAAVLSADPDETRPLSAKRAFEAHRKRGRSPETEKLGSAAFGAVSRPGTAAAPRPSVAAQRRSMLSLPQGPLSVAAAEEALTAATERDAVLEVFFRFARQYFDGTVLFTVKEGVVFGAQSHNVAGLLDVREISLPIARGSNLEELSRTLLPRVVDLSRKEEDRAFVTAMRRADAQPAALIPICIKRRIVGLICGDRDGAPLHLDQLTDLLGLIPQVTSAFERIIRTRKALGLSAPPEQGSGEFSHAPTQRSIPVPAHRPALFGSEARTAQMDERARQALASLNLEAPLAAEKQQAAPEEDGDIYATARIRIQPLPVEQFDSPPRYFAKPPPGTGRYQSVAPTHAGAREILRQPNAASDGKGDPAARPDSRPPRGRSDAPPGRPPDGHPLQGLYKARRAAAEAAATHDSSRDGAAAGAKAGPGSGAYRSQFGTTELISMPHSLRDKAESDLLAKADALLAGTAGNFLLSADPTPANSVAEEAHKLAPTAPTHSSRPPTTTRPPATTSRPPAGQAVDHGRKAVQLLDELCGSEAGEDAPAVKALVALGEPALALLIARFPGPLWFDRRKPHARVPLGRDISPVCRALDAFGDAAVERLIPLLGSTDGEVRYYACLFAADRVNPVLLEPLLARLFDDDPQIRLLVRDALPHYRRFPGFAGVSERLGEQARSESAPMQMRLTAIDAITVLRDAASVPTLISLVSHSDKQISIPCHRALCLITCQDFGKTPRKWRSWHGANASRHRAEWLIEGLMHSEESIRAMAGLELQKLTQVYYGFVAAASKREREAAQKRYADWWHTEGRARLTS